MVFHEPHGVEPHLVGQDALFNGLLDDCMVIEHWPLHFIGQ
jgi:hypothetical protein